MKNKGFTLIELLAVIVILAIIALIATPVILGIINAARSSASEESAKLIVSNVQLAYSTAYMDKAKTGGVPEISEVREAFNKSMDKAVWTGMTITSTGSNVTCDVTKTNKNLAVSCKVGNTEKAKTTVSMELGSTATN